MEIKVYSYTDDDDCEEEKMILSIFDETGATRDECIFEACDLYQCPEDATLGRRMTSGYEIMKTLSKFINSCDDIEKLRSCVKNYKYINLTDDDDLTIFGR